MRLIDADAIRFRNDSVVEFAAQWIIEDQPTVDAEPVAHAYWIDRPQGFQMCSRCCAECREDSDLPFKIFAFCPYCGARMDEEAE